MTKYPPIHLHILVGLLFFFFMTIVPAKATPKPIALPEFTNQQPEHWLNSAPVHKESLQDKVLLVYFWTFDCWNCYRSFPWLKDLEKRLQPMGLQLIGVHTPEFAHEKIRANVEKKIAEFKLQHPVMMDNNFSYWKALNNRYWPAYFLVSKNGNIYRHYYGETHIGSRQAKQIEADILKLLAP